MLAFRAHVTTAAGNSLHIGVQASNRHQADGVIDDAVPGNRGAQLRRVRQLLALVPGRPLHPNESRCRAPAANAARAGELPTPTFAFEGV